jgi:hypothetical protein
MIELAINTITADRRMGSHRAARKCIGDLFLSNGNGRISCEAILFQEKGQGWSGLSNEVWHAYGGMFPTLLA